VARNTQIVATLQCNNSQRDSITDLFFFSLYVFGIFHNFLLCRPSQRSALSQVPSQVATLQKIGSLLWAGEVPDSNLGLQDYSLMCYHWATTPSHWAPTHSMYLKIYDSEFHLWTHIVRQMLNGKGPSLAPSVSSSHAVAPVPTPQPVIIHLLHCCQIPARVLGQSHKKS
jgi:hypothetical protein